MKMSALVKDYLSHNKAFFSQLKAKKSMGSRRDINFSKLSEKVHADYDPVFVLSTGRNGTLLLTHLFGLSKQCIALHEPEPELSMPSKLAFEQFATNPEFVKGMFEGARYEILRTGYLMDKKIIETNNRITFFAHQIAELYPKAKFIHLVRNPASFIKSGIGRNWYSGQTLYDEARIVLSDADQWERMNQYDKIAWLWNETNSFIEDFKKAHENTVLTLKSENLFSDPETANEALLFCGINDIHQSKIKRIISTKTNAGKKVVAEEKKVASAIERYAQIKEKYGY